APAGDTFVKAGTEAGWDHGAADEVEVEQSPAHIVYLKFDLSAVAAPVVRATLTLFSTDASPDGGTLYPVSDSSWVEGNQTGKSSTSASGPGLKWTDLDTNADGKVDARDTSTFVPDFTRPLAACMDWVGQGPAARLTGGDTCDADGSADGSCTAPVTLCLESSAAPGCGPDVLATLKLSSDPRLQALSTAFEDMKAHKPAGASEVCMPVVNQPVGKGRLPLKLQRLGKGRRKTLALVCRPPRPTHGHPKGTTFATIQK